MRRVGIAVADLLGAVGIALAVIGLVLGTPTSGYAAAESWWDCNELVCGCQARTSCWTYDCEGALSSYCTPDKCECEYSGVPLVCWCVEV